ncbi:MAG: hypothetical protein Q8878_07645 [Bacillota bacterium]|nr:hypothetical protein [Bacillota bacterium]
MESPEESADNLFIGVLQSHKSGIRSISSVLLFLLSVFAFCLLIFYLRYKSLFELRFIRNGIIMFLHKKDGMK